MAWDCFHDQVLTTFSLSLRLIHGARRHDLAWEAVETEIRNEANIFIRDAIDVKRIPAQRRCRAKLEIINT